MHPKLIDEFLARDANNNNYTILVYQTYMKVGDSIKLDDFIPGKIFRKTNDGKKVRLINEDKDEYEILNAGIDGRLLKVFKD